MIAADSFFVKKNSGQPIKGAGGRTGRTKKLTPELIAQAAELKKKGAANEQLAAELGIAVSTLYDYQKKSPEFSEALKKGRSFACAVLEGRLYKSAYGITTKQVRKRRYWDATGKKYRTEKHLTEIEFAPNPTSLALFLNNNMPERYARRPEDRPTSPAVVFFQFNVVEVDGTKKAIKWDPKKPLPVEVLPQEPTS